MDPDQAALFFAAIYFTILSTRLIDQSLTCRVDDSSTRRVGDRRNRL
jgi:hypothetical protein